jgi:hypothetical protein
MTTSQLLNLRLHNQQISDTRFRHPAEIVEWMVAMQAQEYAMTKWAIGLRLPGTDETAVEHAFNSGAILRTHVLRPTWHFVTPADIRWLLALTAPRVHAANAFMYRKLELDAALFKRSHATLLNALGEGRPLSRVALQAALKRVGIAASGLRLGYLMMHAELEGLICSGPREGRQFTYALLDERAPRARVLDREAGLAELTRRYFASRGPATAADFAYWSGLTLADAKTGIASLGPEFTHETIDGKAHVFPVTGAKTGSRPHSTFLMPDYDEYGMSYRDRSALRCTLPPKQKAEVSELRFARMIVVDGRIVGTWQRSLDANRVTIETDYMTSPSPSMRRKVTAAARRFSSFIGLSLEIQE